MAYTTISTAGTVTSPTYLDSTALNGTPYYYVVSAVNGGGESLNSSQASATPQPPAPGAPTGLTPTPGNNQVGLSWTAPSGTITSYNVKRATVSGGPYTTISTPGAVTSPSYLDSTAVNGTTYYYVVSAVNGGGESLNSSEAAATPQPPAPGVPTGLTPTPVTARSAWAGPPQRHHHQLQRQARHRVRQWLHHHQHPRRGDQHHLPRPHRRQRHHLLLRGQRGQWRR